MRGSGLLWSDKRDNVNGASVNNQCTLHSCDNFDVDHVDHQS